MEFDIPEMIINILTENNYSFFSQRIEEDDNGDIILEVYGISYSVDKTVWGYADKFIKDFWWFLDGLKKKVEKEFKHPIKITFLDFSSDEIKIDLKFTISMNIKIK